MIDGFHEVVLAGDHILFRKRDSTLKLNVIVEYLTIGVPET